MAITTDWQHVITSKIKQHKTKNDYESNDVKKVKELEVGDLDLKLKFSFKFTFQDV